MWQRLSGSFFGDGDGSSKLRLPHRLRRLALFVVRRSLQRTSKQYLTGALGDCQTWFSA